MIAVGFKKFHIYILHSMFFILASTWSIVKILLNGFWRTRIFRQKRSRRDKGISPEGMKKKMFVFLWTTITIHNSCVQYVVETWRKHKKPVIAMRKPDSPSKRVRGVIIMIFVAKEKVNVKICPCYWVFCQTSGTFISFQSNSNVNCSACGGI